MIDINPIIEALIGLLAAIASVYLIPYLREKYGAEKLKRVRDVVEIAVYAAEKAYGAGKGAEKLAYAETILAAHGVKLDAQRLVSLVDATIKKMEQGELPIIEAVEAIPGEA